MTNDPRRPFRWAILGTGAVARKFVLSLRALDGRATAVCVASRNPENARRFAADLGIATALPDYAAAAAFEADALYVATPPAQHEAHALLGIRAGKAVLIEKPFATDTAAARRIARAAETAGVFCMEALWTRFQPLIGTVQARIEAGDLGQLRGFEGRFMSANIPDPDTGLFDPARGGGALMHRGIYPLSLARFLLGPVTGHAAMAQVGDTGVDEDVVLLLRHRSGALSTIRASARATEVEGTAIYGTTGTLHLHGPIWRPTGATLIRTAPAKVTSGGPRRLEGFRESTAGQRLSAQLARLKRLAGRGQIRLRAPVAGNGYQYQADAVMQAVAAGLREEPRMPLSDSLELMQIIDDVRSRIHRGETS
jgi:predicted dehydrogenase